MLDKAKSVLGGKKLVQVGTGLWLVFTQTAIVFAQDITVKQPGEVKILQIGQLVSALVGLAIIMAALLAFVYLVWGGIEWIMSGGDKAGMEAARNRITAAFVGLIIVAAAWAITRLLEIFFGITILGPEGIQIPSVEEF